jgi:hypothetical protein
MAGFPVDPDYWPRNTYLPQTMRDFSHESTVIAFEWMVSAMRPPPPTAVR